MTDPWIPKFQHLRSKVRHLDALTDEELTALKRTAEELQAEANDGTPGDKMVRQFANATHQLIARILFTRTYGRR